MLSVTAKAAPKGSITFGGLARFGGPPSEGSLKESCRITSISGRRHNSPSVWSDIRSQGNETGKLIQSDGESDHPARAAEQDGRPSGPREFKSGLSSRRSAVRGLQPAQIKGHKFNPFLEAQASDHIFTGREIEASAR